MIYLFLYDFYSRCFWASIINAPHTITMTHAVGQTESTETESPRVDCCIKIFTVISCAVCRGGGGGDDDVWLRLWFVSVFFFSLSLLLLLLTTMITIIETVMRKFLIRFDWRYLRWLRTLKKGHTNQQILPNPICVIWFAISNSTISFLLFHGLLFCSDALNN